MKRLLLLPLLLTFANAEVVLEPLVVSGSAFDKNELDYASSVEIYTKADIASAQSENLYDFLNHSTSIIVMPSYGNLATQLIDLRGYGIGNGYENVVIKVNGRRLNNIDGVPQLLSSIAIDNIERIEIQKGSGSVLNGDGANAGVINIILKEQSDIGFKTYAGNFGTSYGQFSAAVSNEHFTASMLADYYHSAGNREINATTREHDAKTTTNVTADLIWRPTEDLQWYFKASRSDTNTSYAGALNLANFNLDPTQTGGNTGQVFHSYAYSTGLDFRINNKMQLLANIHYEDKLSEYSSGWKSEYTYIPYDLSFNYRSDKFKLTTGVEGFLGSRKGSFDTTSKTNIAGYILTEVAEKEHTLTAGARVENVAYNYTPASGTILNGYHNLQAYELGYNNRLSKTSSSFVNYTHSYQAPSIDRFFSAGTFNSFIKPANVDTVTLGYNNISKNNRLKLAAFYSYLNNEIYYYSTGNWLTSYNTNIDLSQKMGIEFYDKYQINDKIYIGLNYNYIQSTIISEDSNSSYNGKQLPGVSNHNVVATIGYSATPKDQLVLSHSYRSEAFAANDFANLFSQKQIAYNSTDISFSHIEGKLTYFAKIQNLFEYKNGIWIQDDAIYPVNFTRSFQIGLSGKF